MFLAALSGNNGAVKEAKQDQSIFSQPEGIALSSVVGILLMSGIVIFVKKVLLSTTVAVAGKSVAVSGITNPAAQA